MNTENNSKGMRLIMIFFMLLSIFVLSTVFLRGFTQLIQPNLFFGIQLEAPLSIIGNFFVVIFPVTIYLLLWYKKSHKTVITLGYLMIINMLLMAVWTVFVPVDQFMGVGSQLENASVPEVKIAKTLTTVFPLLWAGFYFLIFRYIRKHKDYFVE